MKEITSYGYVKIIKDVTTRSSKPILVKAGTVGTVLEFEKNKKTGEIEYLVELDNDIYDEGEVSYFKREEIEPIDL